MTANHLVIDADCAEITHRLTLVGDPEVMTWSTGCLGITDAPALAGACIAHYAAFADNIVPGLCSAYTYLGCEGRTSPTGSNLINDEFISVPGGGGPDALPQNCAAIIRKNTGLGGRANRGRIFMPGMLDGGNVSNDGVIDTTPLANLTTAFHAYASDAATAGFGMVLFHSAFVRNPAFPPPATTMMANPDTTRTIIASLSVESVIATQRRRLR